MYKNYFIKIFAWLDRLIKLIISIFFYIGYNIVTVFLKIINKPLPASYVVLTYHSVKDSQVDRFKRHMDEILKKGFPVSLDFSNFSDINKHYIAITFDDGYQSVVRNALPIMKKRKIPALLFITTAYLGKKPGWINNPNHENANEILISEQVLKEISEEYVSIGSHSVTHTDLATISKNKVLDEFINSKKTLEKIINKNVNYFSFPFDSFNNELIELSKQAGYKKIYIDIPIFPSLVNNSYLNGRIDISLNDWFIEYRLKMLGAYQWLPIAIYIKQYFRFFLSNIKTKHKEIKPD
jgi:peptidoglycan/xylan/chitin deacetylase (PgdA/CDA1 family)